MKISFSATNPCHMYPMAVEMAKLGALGSYYSGYPEWKLPDREYLDVRTHSIRTTITYGLLKYVPEPVRPSARNLFLWQDHGFDRWVGSHLASCSYIHAIPGQAYHTFRGAARRGARRVLNHATGPVSDWVRIMEPEYARVGLKLTDFTPYDEAYFAREREEYAMADYHCAASTTVAGQLAANGVHPDQIWLVPYGADDRHFHTGAGKPPPREFRIAFAGQLCLRKGMKTLLDALTMVGTADWRMRFYGPDTGETAHDFAKYTGAPPILLHGALSQAELGAALRESSVLVLPSLEEGFGLVVPQALNCGIPVIVSNRVGAKDLVTHRENGSIFPAGDSSALAEELLWWEEHPRRVTKMYDWETPARTLLAYSKAAW